MDAYLWSWLERGTVRQKCRAHKCLATQHPDLDRTWTTELEPRSPSLSSPNLNPDLSAWVHWTWTQISRLEFTVLTTTLLLLRNLTLPAKLIIHLTFLKICRLKIEWKPIEPVDWRKIEVLFGNLCSILNINFLLTEHEGHTGDLNQ